MKMVENIRDRATTEEDLRNLDIGEDFWIELEERIKANERISIGCVGKTRSSKSTVAIGLAHYIFMLMKKYKKTDPRKQFNIMNIARDQYEYSILMRWKNTVQTCIVIDEDNKTEKTGENATTERAFLEDVSNIQAGFYVHTVFCAPDRIEDMNTDIILHVVSKDKESKTSRCRVYYRYKKGEISYPQLLGYIDFFVGDIIKEFLPVEELLFKPNKTKEEEEKLNKVAKKDFYTMYQKHKFQKMSMTRNTGIFRSRDLYSIWPKTEVIDKLKKQASRGKVSSSMIELMIKIVLRKYKMNVSLIGDEKFIKEIKGSLDQYYNLYKEKTILEKMKKNTNINNIIVNEWSKGKISIENIHDPETKIYIERLDIFMDIANSIKETEKYYDKIKAISKEYYKHLEPVLKDIKEADKY